MLSLARWHSQHPSPIRSPRATNRVRPWVEELETRALLSAGAMTCPTMDSSDHTAVADHSDARAADDDCTQAQATDQGAKHGHAQADDRKAMQTTDDGKAKAAQDDTHNQEDDQHTKGDAKAKKDKEDDADEVRKDDKDQSKQGGTELKQDTKDEGPKQQEKKDKTGKQTQRSDAEDAQNDDQQGKSKASKGDKGDQGSKSQDQHTSSDDQTIASDTGKSKSQQGKPLTAFVLAASSATDEASAAQAQSVAPAVVLATTIAVNRPVVLSLPHSVPAPAFRSESVPPLTLSPVVAATPVQVSTPRQESGGGNNAVVSGNEGQNAGKQAAPVQPNLNRGDLDRELIPLPRSEGAQPTPTSGDATPQNKTDTPREDKNSNPQPVTPPAPQKPMPMDDTPDKDDAMAFLWRGALADVFAHEGWLQKPASMILPGVAGAGFCDATASARPTPISESSSPECSSTLGQALQSAAAAAVFLASVRADCQAAAGREASRRRLEVA